MQEKQSSEHAGFGTGMVAAFFGFLFVYSASNFISFLFGSGFVHIDHLFGTVVFGLLFAWAIRRCNRISKRDV